MINVGFLENVDWMNGDNVSWFNKTVTEHYKLIAKKKEDLIKEKLIEKGFEHIIEGMDIRRFPKICCIVQNDWAYYYADNDTDEGAFIIAISNYSSDILEKDFSHNNITIGFKWQDKTPIITYKEFIK